MSRRYFIYTNLHLSGEEKRCDTKESEQKGWRGRARLEPITASRECSSEINRTTDLKTSPKHIVLEAVPVSGAVKSRNWKVWVPRHHGRSDNSFRFMANAHLTSGLRPEELIALIFLREEVPPLE